jgi:hypothetical protein
LLTVGFLEDVVGGFGPDEGRARSFQPLMKWRILPVRSRTLQKVPRWMAWRSMMENHTSTRFSQDAEVGVRRSGTSGPYTVVLHPAKAETGLQSWSNRLVMRGRSAAAASPADSRDR